MTIRSNFYLCLIVSLTLLSVSVMLVTPTASFAARGGNSVGNGGGATALQFTRTARKAIGVLKSMPLDEVTKKQVLKIERAIKTARVGSAPTVILEGLEVDAVNYPTKNRIIVNRTGWLRMKKRSAATRIGFVLHEYALVSGLDDRDYSISDGLVALLRDDRVSDDTQQENVLARFAQIRSEFVNAERALLARGGAHNESTVRSQCRHSGLLRGALLMFENIELVTTWNLTGTPDVTRDELRIATEKLETACAAPLSQPPVSAEAALSLVREALRPLDAILC